MNENDKKNTVHVQKPVFNSLAEFMEYSKPDLKNIADKPWLYDFKFQHDQTLKSIDDKYVNNSFSLDDIESNMMRWRRYKCNYKIKGHYDCDGSFSGRQGYTNWIMRDIYRVLWDFDDIKKDAEYEGNRKAVSASWLKTPEDVLSLKEVNILRYGNSIFDNNTLMGPETMNTVAITLAAHLNYKSLPFFNSDSIWDDFEKSKVDDALDLFFITTACLGNMVLVPAYFNPYRPVRGGTYDFWDLSLLLLKNKQNTEKWEYTQYGRTYTIEWTSDDFNRYINCFFLWDYVCPDENGKEYCVKALFKSHRGKSDSKGDNDVNGISDVNGVKDGCNRGFASMECESKMPKEGTSDYTDFFRAANENIIRRGIFMYAMLKIALIEDDIDKKDIDKADVDGKSSWRVSESYKNIMDKVFLQDDKIYGSCNDVFIAIKDVLEADAQDSENTVEKQILSIIDDAEKELALVR